MPQESIHDITTGPNLTEEQRGEFMDLAKQISSLFTEAHCTNNLVQHHLNSRQINQ